VANSRRKPETEYVTEVERINAAYRDKLTVLSTESIDTMEEIRVATAAAQFSQNEYLDWKAKFSKVGGTDLNQFNAYAAS